MNKLIDLFGQNTRLDKRTYVVHQLGVESPGSPHSIAIRFGKLKFFRTLQHNALRTAAVKIRSLAKIDPAPLDRLTGLNRRGALKEV
jgi:hypothetical protein